MYNFDSLNKKIILTNNLINGKRFIFKYNLKGYKFINYDILTKNMLIRMLLAKTNPDKTLISDKEASYIISMLFENNDYGISIQAMDHNIAGNLIEMINDYRFNKNDTFKGLIGLDYKKILNDYYDYLNDNNLCDYIMALSLIEDLNINDELYILDDLTLRPLEDEIINKVFINKKEIKSEINKPNFKGFYECYGIYNELLNIINIIKENNIASSDVEIIYNNRIYENFIIGLFDYLNIPYTLKNASAKSTNIISFMLDVIRYIESDFIYELVLDILKNKGIDDIYLHEFDNSLLFPKVIVGYSYERTKLFLDSIKDDDNKKNLYEFLNDLINISNENMIVDFDKLTEFITKYIKAERELINILPKIKRIKDILKYSSDINKTIKEELESIKYTEKDKDSVSIAPLSKTFSIKKHLFIIGLSQLYLKRYDTKNPFIEDEDKVEKELIDDPNTHILANLKNEAKDELDYLIYHSESDIYLSYSYFDKIDLRPSSASVYFLNLSQNRKINKINLYPKTNNSILFNKFMPEEDKLEKENYDNRLLNDDVELSNHLDKLDIKHQIFDKKIEKNDVIRISPSALLVLDKCPYKYLYQYIYKIGDRTFPKLNEYEWLEPNEKGTYFHEIMELYGNKALMKDNFTNHLDEKIFDEAFNEATKNAKKRNVIKNEFITQAEIKDIKKLAKKYLNNIIKNDFINNDFRMLASEYEILNTGSCYESEGKKIYFRGSVDRIDGYLDNDILYLRLIDYKTGKYKNKKENDYLQHIIYPYALVNAKNKLFGLDYNKIIVKCFIYDYPFSNKINKYDDVLNENDLNILSGLLDNFIIPYLNEDDNYFANLYNYFNENYIAYKNSTPCDYCSYKNYCLKRIEGGYQNWKKK